MSQAHLSNGTAMPDPSAWRRSSKCANSGCVEVAADQSLVRMRDSKICDSAILRFEAEEWRRFVNQVQTSAEPESEPEPEPSPVGVEHAGDVIRVRAGNDVDGPALTFDEAEWHAFIEGVRSGEFDV
jgi:hypothetical protein